MEWKAVTYEASDGVALITLNRPHRSNARTGRRAFEYRTAMQLAEELVSGLECQNGEESAPDERG